MMNLKKLLVACTAVLMLMGLSVTASAVETDADTGTDTALEEWKAARLDRMEERLEAFVAAGSLTREQADAMLEAMIQRQENCDGTNCGNQAQCDGTGAGFRGGNQAQCDGTGMGFRGGNPGRGQGRGQGLGRGSMGCFQ